MKKRAFSLLHTLVFVYVIAQPFFGFSFFNIGGKGVARVDWLGILLLALGFALSLMDGHSHFRYSPVNKFVWLYVGTVFLSLLSMFDASNAQFIDFGTKGFALFACLTAYFILSSISMDDRMLKQLLRVWFALTFVISLYGLYQIFARPLGLPFAELSQTNPTMALAGNQTYRVYSGYSEVSSVFKEPGWLGDYLLSAIVFFGLIILNKQDRLFLFSSLFFNRFVLVTILMALFFSGGMGATLFFVIGFVGVFFFGAIPRKRLLQAIVAGMGLVVISVSALPLFGVDIIPYGVRRLTGLYENILDPRNTVANTSFRNRLNRTLGALAVWWEESPIVGVGLNGVGYYNWKYVEDKGDIGNVNNGWASILAEQGILGFLAMLMVIASAVHNLWRNACRPNLAPGWRTLLTAVGWLIVINAVATLVAFSYVHSLRWFTLGLANLILIESQKHFFPKTIPNLPSTQTATPNNDVLQART